MLLRLRNSIAGLARDLLYPPGKMKADREQSELKGESVPAWWERHHAGGAKFWLSGSRPARVWSLLRVPDRLKPGTRVLDIGVGLGNASRALKKRGCVVDALDISDTALRKVARFTELRFTPDLLATMPTARYSVAISFLVAQHMNHEDLEEQLVHVIRALNSGGIFAIQVACPFSGPTLQATRERQKCGAVLRCTEDFENMVRAANGQIIWGSEIGRFSEHHAFWMAYHITR
jgi:SAM-dependent methyltransferase